MNAFDTLTEEAVVDLGEMTDSLGFMLRLAQLRLFERFFQGFAEAGVRPGEFTVLWVIALNPGVRQGALARVLTIKPAHMTKLVQRLVADGLVRRHIPPQDRRSVELTLTGAGRDYLDRHRATFLRVHDTERDGLTEAEGAELLRLLAKLAFAGGAPCP